MKLSRELVKHKLYYLAHPLSGDPDKNRVDAANIELELFRGGVFVVNPLLTIPPNTPEPVAMGKCDRLLKACDGIILCQNWRKSTGCRHEKILAEEWELEIIEVKEG